MSWPPAQLMAWIERIEAREGRATYFELLEIGSTADSESIVSAFHRIAVGAHPDLHRKSLSAAESERLVRAYGKVAAAYHTLRDPGSRDRYRRELSDRGRPQSSAPVVGGSQPIPIQRPVTAAQALGARTARVSAGYSTDPSIARTRTPSGPAAPLLERTRPSSPPPRARAPSPSPPPSSRTTIPPSTRTPTAPIVARTTTPPSVGRTTTPPSVGRTTTPPSIGRTPTPSRAGTGPGDTRAPLITPPPARAGSRTDPLPGTTRPPASASVDPPRRKDSRPPTAGVSARAQIYFRKAQSCLNQGDLGGALFNLRLAAAADPGSALIRVALAEVENEILGKK